MNRHFTAMLEFWLMLACCCVHQQASFPPVKLITFLNKQNSIIELYLFCQKFSETKIEQDGAQRLCIDNEDGRSILMVLVQEHILR